MTWVDTATLFVSAGTLIYLIINGLFSLRNRKKDRRVTVTLEEKRNMRKELFEHITSVLDLGRKCHEVSNDSEKQEMKLELLNHKVFIWINLNRENGISKDIRQHLNVYITWCASSLEKDNNKDKKQNLIAGDRNIQRIWKLIDSYIEEEERLTNELI